MSIMIFQACNFSIFKGKEKMQVPDLKINEFLSIQSKINKTNNPLKNTDWIELYNASDIPVNLSGMYLTDCLCNPKKYRFRSDDKIENVIQPQSYKVIYLDGKNETDQLNANFRLNGDGEQIGLYMPDGVTPIDTITFSTQLLNISFGRLDSTPEKWGFFLEPTPGKSNSSNFYPGKVKEPVFSMPSGFYINNIILKLKSSGDFISYTLNGDDPKKDNSSTNKLITLNIDSTTVVKAQCYSDDLLPGQIITQTYFINAKHELPILSLSISQENLYDNYKGLFKGKKVKKKRNVPAYMEYYVKRKRVVAQDVIARNSGNYSKFFPQVPITLYAGEDGSRKEFKYKFFNNRSQEKFDAIIVRNSGNDWGRTMFRDALVHSIVYHNNMEAIFQAYQPVATYLNGQYWGLYNLREKINKRNLSIKYNLKVNDLHLLEIAEDGYIGDTLAYRNTFKDLELYITNDSNGFNYLCTILDIGNYIDYMITEIYAANIDWITNNVKLFNHKNEPWKWLLFDLDQGFIKYDFNGFLFASGRDEVSQKKDEKGNYKQNTRLFHYAMGNSLFRDKFYQRCIYLLDSAFLPENVNYRISSIQNLIAPEMSMHLKRWGNTGNKNPINMWKREIEKLTEFAANRPEIMKQQLEDFILLY